MGLDIRAYRQLTKINPVLDEDGEPIDPHTREWLSGIHKVYSNPDFPGRAEGLEDGAFYAYADADKVFECGYRGYNIWREALAKLAGYTPVLYERVEGHPPSAEMSHQAGAFEADGGPFHELICFSDCEGDIGPVVAARLLKDFVEWDERAKAVTEAWEFYEGYTGIRRGLEMAADNGALSFG